MLGIIGGTGLYQMDELQVTDVREVTTPFGSPSSPIVLGMLRGRNVAFLARHGLHHDLLPSESNYRGNIRALKSLGVRPQRRSGVSMSRWAVPRAAARRIRNRPRLRARTPTS
jgi:hypothetical protein